MKRLMIAVLVAMMALTLLVPVASGRKSPSMKAFKRVENRVKLLEVQASQLQRRSDTLLWMILYTDCVNAIQFDWLQFLTDLYGIDSGDPYDDQGSCAAVGIDRYPRGLTTSVWLAGAMDRLNLTSSEMGVKTGD